MEYTWWQRGIIYQIYPRSFQDSNGDGTGDLPGIIERLDYLQWLGIEAIWLSPFYPSPMADFGYDVADYCNVDPLFGTLDDFDRLVAGAHERGLKVIIDFVPNHTSNEHPWFVESTSSRDNPKRDWYIWRDPTPDGGPPNNWQSLFGGPAWTFDPTTGQYYLHSFLKEQPDLNWRNPEVRRAMFDALRFWMGRGVDGFRVDVIWLLIKDAEFRDNPPNPDYDPDAPLIENRYFEYIPAYSQNRPEVHEVIREMRAVVDEYPDRVLIGEIYLPFDQLMHYYGSDGLMECQLPFNFSLVLHRWNARGFEQVIHDYESLLPAGAWPNWVLGNHDRPRVATRAGTAQSRVAQMLLLTLRGTPTMYYGDEIGMHDVDIPEDRIVDPQGRHDPRRSRDPERTPMQWDDLEHAGFSTGLPWLPIARDYTRVNVAAEQNEATSVLSLVHALIALRQSTPALAIGSYSGFKADGDVLAYLREHGDQRYLIALNFGSATQQLDLGTTGYQGEVVLGTYHDRAGDRITGAVMLRPDEGIIARVQAPLGAVRDEAVYL